MKSRQIRSQLTLLAGLSLSTLLWGCDPNHEKKCEWFLMPEPKLAATADEGKIPVCARNLEINKEYCRLQADFDFVKENYGKKFRYVDMTFSKEGRFPRTISQVRFCD